MNFLSIIKTFENTHKIKLAVFETVTFSPTNCFSVRHHYINVPDKKSRYRPFSEFLTSHQLYHFTPTGRLFREYSLVFPIFSSVVSFYCLYRQHSLLSSILFSGLVFFLFRRYSSSLHTLLGDRYATKQGFGQQGIAFLTFTRASVFRIFLIKYIY